MLAGSCVLSHRRGSHPRITDIQGKGESCVAASRGELVAREPALLLPPRNTAWCHIRNGTKLTRGVSQEFLGQSGPRTEYFIHQLIVPGVPGYNFLSWVVFETSHLNHRCGIPQCPAITIADEALASCYPAFKAQIG